MQPFDWIAGCLRSLDARGDEWARKRLSPQEWSDAKAFDTQFKRNIWRWLLLYLAVGAAGAVMLRYSFDRFARWTPALVTAYIATATLALLFLSAWFRYAKFTGRRAPRSFASLVLGMFGGGIVASIVATMLRGQPVLEMPQERITLILTSISVVAVIVVGFTATVAAIRERQVRQRLRAAEADADRERLARQGTQAELKLLQAQIEPHFLFNTLANLRVLVQTDTPGALEMLDHLIHYLRTALPEIRADSSTVGREIELSRSYLEILRIRMGGALEIAATAPRDIASRPFPPMMLLTLVENAIKHGIAPVGHGSVRVSAQADDERVRMIVEDDGRGLGGAVGTGVGLSNIRERLRALFGDRATLTLAAREDGGTVATIEVPA